MIRFGVLGPLEVAVEGQPLRLGSAHQRVLLTVLLVARGAPVSTGRLIDALWDDAPPPTARRSLHSHVARLRRALTRDGADDATDLIITDVDGYRLDLRDHDLDAERFESLLGQARAELETDPERAVASLDQALALWRGGAFGELASHPSVRGEAVRLDGLRTAAAGDRVDARLAVGDHHGVIGDLEAATTDDPLAERAHRQLMLALYRDGRQADALAVYRRLQDTLREELGVDPSPEVQLLHERILRQDPALQAPARTHASGADPVPDDQGQLIGRHDDVAEVAALVRPGSLVTLTGPGGVGKSRLARAVVAVAHARFDEGVVVCELAAVRDPDSVPASLLDALAVQQLGASPPESLIAAAVGTRQVLLVLDNCEHLLSAVSALVDHLRERCPNLAILATSREYLHLSGEQVREVAPLPVPAADADAAQVAATASGALFCLRAQQAEPSFALTDDNAATVAQLCRRLDGVPLALELAAARARALALDALAQRIGHRFELLTGGSHLVTGRHRTLHAMVEWSYELLTDTEAHLFDRLSVFAGSFPLDAVERVCAGGPLAAERIAGLLAELVDKSLVVVDRSDGGVRYGLLDTLRAYGAAQLDPTDADGVRAAHAAYHVELAEVAGAEVAGPDERSALARLDVALDDLRVAHRWLVTEVQVDQALRLPAALHDDLIFRPRDEVFAWTEKALNLDGADACPGYRGALATAARGALNRGDLDRARHLAESALEADGPPDRPSLWALFVLTTTALYEARFGDALTFADRRVELADALGQDYHRALARVSRVLVHIYDGDPDAAVRAADEAREAAEVSGNLTAQAWALYSHGEARLETDPDEAAKALQAATAAARRVDRRFIEGVALVSLASLTGRRGETDRALALFRETVAHWRRLGVYTQQLTTLRNLVELLVRVGADEPAATLHGAVTAGATPTFGAEAERLTAAWDQLEGRLGPAAQAAADRGRSLTTTQTVDAALDVLDDLLGGHRARRGSRGNEPVRAAPPGP